MIETLVALLALTPFIAGIPLLGKQLDIKQKAYGATRYSAWERTVWSSDGAANTKSHADILAEARDRAFGHPQAGLTAIATLQADGVTENPLWRDIRNRRLLDSDNSGSPLGLSERTLSSPVAVGEVLVPGVAHGEGVLHAMEVALQLDNLKLDPRAFTNVSLTLGIRPVLGQMADRASSLARPQIATRGREPIMHTATGAILSNTWSSRDERSLARRVDDVTADELIEDIELPGRGIGLQASGKGRPLYGEAQYGWSPDLEPRSTVLPSAYLVER